MSECTCEGRIDPRCPVHEAEMRSPDVITDADRDVANLMIRAGYLRGLAERATGDDRVFLLRASRSLLAFAAHAEHCSALRALRDAPKGTGRNVSLGRLEVGNPCPLCGELVESIEGHRCPPAFPRRAERDWLRDMMHLVDYEHCQCGWALPRDVKLDVVSGEERGLSLLLVMHCPSCGGRFRKIFRDQKTDGPKGTE